MCFFLAATNEIHKRAHQDAPPLPFRVLQRVHVLLPASVHDIHHESPFARYYCITTGWLNAPLTAVGFFSTVERIITRTTGAIPRQDDIGREAALELAASLGIIREAAPGCLEPVAAKSVKSCATMMGVGPGEPVRAAESRGCRPPRLDVGQAVA